MTRFAAGAAALLLLGAAPSASQTTISETFSDPAGDAFPLGGVAPDLASTFLNIDALDVAFGGALTGPIQIFDSLFQSGATVLPGASEQYLGTFYQLLIDADNDPSTGFFGLEYSFEVTFSVTPVVPGDFSAGVSLASPLIALQRMYSPSGAETSQIVNFPVNRTSSGFSMTIPRSALSLGPEISVEIVSATFGGDGGLGCVSPSAAPTFCSFFSDAAPDPAREITLGPGGGVDDVFEFTMFRDAVRESQESIGVTVRRTPAAARGVAAGALPPASVDVIVTGGSATFGAPFTSEGDYTGPTPSTADFSSGQTSVDIFFDIVDDAEAERQETINLGLVNPSGGSVGQRSKSQIVILDNDVRRGAPKRVGGSTARAPLVIYDAKGRKVVLWDQIVGGVRQICAQLFNAAGEAASPVFLVAANPGFDQVRPSGAFSGNGGLAVVFEQFPAGSAGKANGDAVGAFLTNPSDAGSSKSLPLGDEGNASSPKVAADRDGNIVATWNEGDELKGQEFDDERRMTSGPFSIGSADSDSEPEVASSASGAYAAVWRERTGSSSARIMTRRYNKGGRARGPASVVDQGFGVDNPSLSMAANGAYVVTYEKGSGSGTDIYAVRYNRRGEVAVAPRKINRVSGNNTNPSVALNSVGEAVVVWENGASAKGSQASGDVVGAFLDQGLDETTDEVPVAQTESGAAPTEPEVSLDDDDQTTVVYTRRGGGQPDEIFQTELSPSLSSGVCDGGSEELCLENERFSVTVVWEDFQGGSGEGQAVPLTTDSGYMWFFSESNVEMVVKVLNGCPLNDRFWVFAGGLTNVGVTLTVNDSVTGTSRSYVNGLGTDFAPIQDTDALEACTEDDALVFDPELVAQQSALPVCADDSEALCLGAGQRFRVKLDWRTEQGTSGVGMPTGLTTDTGYFWFFDAANVEVVVKVLDGCALNDRFWIFAGGLTNVETTMTVTDSATGQQRVYRNTLGQPFQPILDTDGLSGCSASPKPRESGRPDGMVPGFPVGR